MADVAARSVMAVFVVGLDRALRMAVGIFAAMLVPMLLGTWLISQVPAANSTTGKPTHVRRSLGHQNRIIS